MSHRVTFDDLLPTQEPDPESRTDFDLALRGYDRRQVDDYLIQVDETLADATRKVHGAEQQAVEAKRAVARLTQELERESERVGGEPEPKAAVGPRIAQILTLAEQDAAETVARARAEAEQILADARRRHAEATELHDRATKEVDSAMTARRQEAERVAVEVATEARQSADALRQQSHQEAEERRVGSEREATRVVREARKQADRMAADSRRMVSEAMSQRDRIARQLASLRKGLAEVAPDDTEPPPA